MVISGVGLFILASPVAMFDISYSPESDIMAYAVVRYFGMDNYSTVLALVTGRRARSCSASYWSRRTATSPSG
ncbi:MAG TPA: hypothetical protein VF463_04420 [Sphingobium sp.]